MGAFSQFIAAASITALSTGFAFAANDNDQEQCIDMQSTPYSLSGTSGAENFLKSRHNDLLLSETWNEINALRSLSSRLSPVEQLCLLLDTSAIGDEQEANTLYLTETNELPYWKSLAREYIAFAKESFVNLNKQGQPGFNPGEEYYDDALRAARIEALTLAFSMTVEMQMGNIQGNDSFTEMLSDPLVQAAVNTNAEVRTAMQEIVRILNNAKTNNETSLSWSDLRQRFDYAGTGIAPERLPFNGESFYNIGGLVFGKIAENITAVDPQNNRRGYDL